MNQNVLLGISVAVVFVVLTLLFFTYQRNQDFDKYCTEHGGTPKHFYKSSPVCFDLKSLKE